MSKVAQLKKKAAELELKKQFDKALAIYVEILDGYERNPEEVDVALFNRVGDLMLRQGNVADAIDYYERAVDLYAEGGFFNNAIALCNKILRQSPGRASVYYKLGKISAQKGFKSDAKRNFLEYADRMQKSGRVDEAFRALKEFADLCPDQDDIRLMLAEQLSKQERTAEAIEQLQTLYDRYVQTGREVEARATIDRMRAIDPSVTPRGATGAMRVERAQDLVFLDLDESPMRAGDFGATGSATPVPPPEPIGLIEQSGIAGGTVPLPGRTSSEFERVEGLDVPTLDGVSHQAEFEAPAAGQSTLEGFETTGLESASPTPADPSGALLDFEPTSMGGFAAPAEPPPVAVDPPVLDAVTDAGLDIDLSALGAAQGHRDPTAHTGDSASQELAFLEGADAVRPSPDLPMIDIGDETLEEISIEDWRGHRERALEAPAAGSPVDGLPLMDLDLPATRAEPSVAPTPMMGGLDLDAVVGVPESATPAAGEIFLTPGTPTNVAPHTRAVERSIEELRAVLDREPGNAEARRALGEAYLEAGHRDDGLDELERAMTAFERGDDLSSAASVADEIVRANPMSVRMQQKRVEYAFRTNDKPRLVEAYLDLASSLLQGGQADKARAVYQRVLDLTPEEPRALAALATFGSADIATAPGRIVRDDLGAARPAAAASEFVNLGDMLRDDPPAMNTRLVVEEKEPTGDEEADFAEMLRRFKQGIAENVAEEDHQSHYDLGIAFKEMGLVDEAIAEFQKALRSPSNRVPTYEALGQCFVEKEQYQLAATVLERALSEPRAGDDALIGVLYLLGRSAEALGRRDEALSYYQRVFVLDIQFRDVARRIADVEQAGR